MNSNSRSPDLFGETEPQDQEEMEIPSIHRQETQMPTPSPQLEQIDAQALLEDSFEIDCRFTPAADAPASTAAPVSAAAPTLLEIAEEMRNLKDALRSAVAQIEALQLDVRKLQEERVAPAPAAPEPEPEPMAAPLPVPGPAVELPLTLAICRQVDSGRMTDAWLAEFRRQVADIKNGEERHRRLGSVLSACVLDMYTRTGRGSKFGILESTVFKALRPIWYPGLSNDEYGEAYKRDRKSERDHIRHATSRQMDQ